MSNILLPLTRQQFFGNTGEPLAYGLVYTYAAGTTTPVTTYNASGGTNPNPVVLDFRGMCDLWGILNQGYKINVTDSAGNQIPGWPIDNINLPATTSSGTFSLGGTGFSGTAPTFSCNYQLVGSLVLVNMYGAFGTSNSTTFGLSGVPTALQPPTATQYVPIAQATNNGAQVSSGISLSINAGQTFWTMQLNGQSSGWTAANSKGFPLVYQPFTYMLL